MEQDNRQKHSYAPCPTTREVETPANRLEPTHTLVRAFRRVARSFSIDLGVQ